jgi:hypothetical protein
MTETIDQLRERAELLAEITRMDASAEWQAVVASWTCDHASVHDLRGQRSL